MDNAKIIAVDFDGTIVENAFPDIGKEMPEAITTLKRLQNAGYFIVLWTCRNGAGLKDAVNWLYLNGFTPGSVNENSPENLKYFESVIKDHGEGRKVFADIYIDDRNLNGFPGWNTVAEKLL